MTLPVSSGLFWFAVIFVIAALLYGLRDVRRFSIRRISAIAGVCFSDALRRRVLWVTPAAMAATAAVSLLGRPADALEAVSLTLQAATFASAIILVAVVMLLAATNLPREIENRVIFTVATKPTTRLEIILGKLVGISGVAAVILLLLGAFTFGLVMVQAWSISRDITRELSSPDIDPASRNRLEHHAASGLLASRTLAQAERFQLTALPTGPNDRTKWISSPDMRVETLFVLNPVALVPQGMDPSVTLPGEGGIMIEAELEVKVRPDITGPGLDAAPMVQIEIVSPDGMPLVQSPSINDGELLSLSAEPGMQKIRGIVEPGAALNLQNGEFIIRITPANSAYIYGFGPHPVSVYVPSEAGYDNAVVFSTQGTLDASQGNDVLGAANFRGNFGRVGMYLPAAEADYEPTLLFRFRNVQIHTQGEQVPMELTAGIDRGGLTEDGGDTTALEIVARSADGSRKSQPITVMPENGRTVYFELPADVVTSGNFDVILRNKSVGHFVGFMPDAVHAVISQRPFLVNLLASSVLLWFLSIVVAAIALFCSTFVSWPIAVMLTVLAVTGRFVVERIEPDNTLGRRMGEELFSRDATRTHVVSNTIDALSAMLNTVADVLPNLAAFGKSLQLEAGLTISVTELAGGLVSLLMWAVPLSLAAYVILRNKEVAP